MLERAGVRSRPVPAPRLLPSSPGCSSISMGSGLWASNREHLLGPRLSLNLRWVGTPRVMVRRRLSAGGPCSSTALDGEGQAGFATHGPGHPGNKTSSWGCSGPQPRLVTLNAGRCLLKSSSGQEHRAMSLLLGGPHRSQPPQKHWAVEQCFCRHKNVTFHSLSWSPRHQTRPHVPAEILQN